MTKDNCAFQEMFQAAKTMLSGKDPVQMAKFSAVSFDGENFWIPSLGQEYSFSYPDWVCRAPLNHWHYLVMLHYLHLADDFPLSGELCGMGDLPDGLIRGTKYDRSISQALSALLNDKSEAQLRTALLSLGGEMYTGKADICFCLPFLPRFPLYLNIWLADEEFPPSARLLVDRNAGHYLTIEDAVSVGDVTLELLNKALS